jgi:hypothetical protein
MARADNTVHILQAAKQRHDDSVNRTIEAIRRLERGHKPINFRTVADAARVSRGWLYTNPQLRDAITARRSTPPRRRNRTVPPAQRGSAASLQSRINALTDEVRRLRHENAELKNRIQRLYGQNRAAQIPTIQPHTPPRQ